MRKILVVAGIAAIVAALLYFGPTRQGEAPSLPILPASPPSVARSIPKPPEDVPFKIEGATVEAIQSRAEEWRRSARREPEFRRRLIDLLSDASLREIAAFVLGTLPDRDAQIALAESLRASKDPQWTRTLLLALGCEKTSEDDDIFDLPETPGVIVTPLKLSVRIRGALEEPEVRAAMVPHLQDPDAPGVRWAAALALAGSTSFPEVRGAFLAALPGERDPAAEGELAKALSGWAAGENANSPERLRTVAAIFDGAARPEATALRFRSEEGLARMQWTSAEARLLTTRTEEGSLDQRRWAIAVLAGAASRLESSDQAAALETLTRISTNGTEAKAREFAVSGLAGFGGRASPALIAALGDSAWHVRAAAVRALGRVGKSDAVISALRDAEAKDADERVRRAAAEVRRAYGAD